LPESVERFSGLPMTGTGKIQRYVLRDAVSQRRAAASQ
jgi:acyl-coenzyme A synthetase/AMP-(fatty) acid ligase